MNSERVSTHLCLTRQGQGCCHSWVSAASNRTNCETKTRSSKKKFSRKRFENWRGVVVDVVVVVVDVAGGIVVDLPTNSPKVVKKILLHFCVTPRRPPGRQQRYDGPGLHGLASSPSSDRPTSRLKTNFQSCSWCYKTFFDDFWKI